MAVGDIIASSIVATTSGLLNIQPTGTEEWVIHNINHQSDAELWIVSTAASSKIDSHSGNGGWNSFFFHTKNNNYYMVKNIDSGGASGLVLSFDGIITHV